jgi:putative acetyltransferase
MRMQESGDPLDVVVRPMRADELPEMLDLWVAAWQAAYPAIDFAQRRDWMADWIAVQARAGAQSLVALADGRIVGALIINPQTGYLDQLVVAAQSQRRGIAGILLAEARRLSPDLLELNVNQDNARAIAFYRKNGFAVTGKDVNPRSGAPIYLMRWRP